MDSPQNVTLFMATSSKLRRFCATTPTHPQSLAQTRARFRNYEKVNGTSRTVSGFSEVSNLSFGVSSGLIFKNKAYHTGAFNKHHNHSIWEESLNS